MFMSRLALAVLAGVVVLSAGGSDSSESAGDERTIVASSPAATPPTDSERATPESPAVEPARSQICGERVALFSELSEAQFAFVGTVVAADDEVHPWTTDPENPNRGDAVETTRWVTFEVERWHTPDWGVTFSVWAPGYDMKVGQRLAVGGNAYHTEVRDFSGQSGEVEICSTLLESELSPDGWSEFFGRGTPPSPEVAEDEPSVLVASKVFGETTEPCDVTVLNNGPEDEVKIAEGAACFVGEFEAQRPLVWDVVVVTVEGDPIPSRYSFDGETVIITTDYSFDNFGSGGVVELRCSSVRLSNWLPEGTDCSSHDGEGFRPDSLP
jgi:hypothetical protein